MPPRRSLRIAQATKEASINDTPASSTKTSSEHPLFHNQDVMLIIAKHLDLPSALSFARVCRFFETVSHHRIWRDVDLSLPYIHRGRPGLMQFPGAAKEAEDELQRERLRVKEKADRVCGQLQAKGSFIRRITWSCDGVGVDATLEVLEAAASNVESLEVSSQQNMGELSEDYAPFCDILVADGDPFAFDRLTTLIVGANAVETVDTIPHLLDSCPHLSTLDITIGRFRSYESPKPSAHRPFPAPNLVVKSTTLRRMRIAISEGITPGRVPEPSYDPAVDPLETVLSLLRHSIHLRQLSLDFDPAYHNRADAVLAALDGLGHLTDLYWAGLLRSNYGRREAKHNKTYRLPKTLMAPGVGQVKRLTLRFGQWKFPRYEWCGLENVETVILDCDARCGDGSRDPIGDLSICDTVSDLTASGGPSSGRQLGFATWLKTHPRLHHIYYITFIHQGETLRVFDHLDSIAGDTTPTIKIRSYRHGGEECFHATVLVQSVEPLICSPVTGLWEEFYDAGALSSEVVAHERTHYACSTDPLGADTALPLEVLEKMREVEGASVEEWDRRGVEVGAEAWKVLMDSREVR